MADATVQNEGPDSDVAKRFRFSHGSPTTCTTTAATTIYTPPVGMAPRLKWIGFSAPDTNTQGVLATLFIGSTPIYSWWLSPGAGFAHGVVREGNINDALSVTLSAAMTVYANLDVEDFVSD